MKKRILYLTTLVSCLGTMQVVHCQDMTASSPAPGPVVAPAESGAPASGWRKLHKQALDAYTAGDLAQAEKLWTDAIWDAEHSTPPEIEPGVVNCLVGLAFVFDRKGNFGESERVYELAMRDLEGLVGRGSVRYTDFMLDLAELYDRHSRPDQAEVTFKELIGNRERQNDPLKLAEALPRYAKFLRRHGRSDEANIQENRSQALKTGASVAPN